MTARPDWPPPRIEKRAGELWAVCPMCPAKDPHRVSATRLGEQMARDAVEAHYVEHLPIPYW